MRIPVAWLREFIPVPEEASSLESFCDALTMAGLEVEEILDTPIGPALFTKITPNRGDWASVLGTAREAAAALRLPVPGYPSFEEEGSPEAGAGVSIHIEAPDACPRYAAKILRGVRIGPAPDWIQQRLSAALGDRYRPVNSVVDITNYVMLELGQPLHAFDLDTIPGGEVIVRLARPGEKIATLDDVERDLDPSILCICDREKPIAIAGVMGGAATEISERTVNILLESAHFDPLSIRRASKRLGLKTEASYRFERYVDPTLVPIAAERAARLIIASSGGVAVPGLADVVARPVPRRRVLARVDRIRKLLGVDMDREEMIAGLERLGISVDRIATNLDCGIPTWRPDLAIEEDIAEEVGRIALGYENLPDTPPPVENPNGGDSPRGRFVQAVRQTLVSLGLQEVHTHSLTAPSTLDPAELTERRVCLRSPRSPEYSVLRLSLLPNLLAIAERAHRDGIRDIGLFEIGPVYLRAEQGDGYVEPLRVSGVVTGSGMPSAWSLKPDAYPVDFYYVKGVVECLLQRFGVTDLKFSADTRPIAHPGRTASVAVAGRSVGWVGELSELAVESHDLPRRTYVFDLDGEELYGLFRDVRVRYQSLSPYPAVVRDLAPVFPDSVEYGTLHAVAVEAAGPLLESLRLTDVYSGASLGEGKRSLTLRFTFRSPERTLQNAEVEEILDTVRNALIAAGGEFR